METRFSQDMTFQRMSSCGSHDYKTKTSAEGSQYGSAQTEDRDVMEMSQDNFSFHSLDLNQPRKGSIEDK